MECRLDGRRRLGSVPSQCCSGDEPAGDHSRVSNSSGSSMQRLTAPPRALPLVLVAGVLPALAFGLLACDSSPPDTDVNQPPTAVAEATPQDTTTDAEVTFDASGSTDPDDDASSLTYDWEFGDGNSGSGETVSHTYGSDGEYTAELSVSDGESAKTDEVTVSITEPKPDSVAITYRPLDTDGNVLEDAEVTDGDVSGTGKFTDSVPYSTNSREVTAKRDGYEDGSSTYTPERSQTVEITLSEKTAEVMVKAEGLETEIALSSQLELSADGETVASGVAPLTTEVSVSVDELTVSAAEHEQDKEVYADTSETFVLEDSPVTVGQRRVPHCVNGLDNDGDDLTGVGKDIDGDGFIDANDPGCTSRQDDGEEHRVFVRSAGGAGEATRKTFVSSNKGDWAIKEYNSSDFPEHIRVAVGNIYFRRNVKLSSAQSGESFATRFECGSEVNISAVTEDDPSVDGWYEPVLEGITTNWFSQDTYCEIGYVHKAFVNENPGDGDDDVVLSEEGRGVSLIISWVYEPDHPDLNKSMNKPETTGSDGVTVRSSGYVQVPTENQ